MNLVERYHRHPSSRLTRFSWVVPRLHNWTYKSRVGRQVLSVLAAVNSTLSSALGRGEAQPRFHTVAGRGEVRTIYRRGAENSDLTIVVELARVVRHTLQRIYVANELGGSHFTLYWDSCGLRLAGDAVGVWTRIQGPWAAFYAPALDWGFRVEIPQGVTAFRGREVFPQHGICWSGIILMPAISTERLVYRIRFGPAASLREEPTQ